MQKKKIIIFTLILAIAAGVGFYIYNKESKIKKVTNNTQKEQGETGDPFANINFPDGIDEATREVIQKNIDGTRTMYAKIPEAWETWIAIGRMREMLKDYDGALSAYRQSIILQGNNVLGYRNMAEVYKNNLQDYEKAQEYYKLALENNSIDSELYISLAQLQQYRLNNLETAEDTLLDGLNNAIDKKDILLRLISLYKKTNQSDKQTQAEERLKQVEQQSGNGEPIGTIGIQ